MAGKDNVQIAPAEGKLGVLIPGMGAVTTTFIAGVEAIKRGLGQPIGSLTQMATIRLGKRTDGRTPKIKDFVPLAGLNDLVFGGWDIFEDNGYEAAVNAGVLERPLLDQLKEPLSAIKPMKAVFDPRVRQAHRRPEREAERHQDGQGRDADGRHRAVPQVQRRRAAGHDLVRLDRGVPPAGRRPPDAEGLRMRPAQERSRTSRPARSTPTPR